jgi:hypothetical protein
VSASSDGRPGSGPTVALVVPQGFAARLLLRTEVLPALRAAGARVVVLTPNPDEPYLRAELGPDVALEALLVGTALPRPSRAWYLLVTLRNHVLAGGDRLSTIRTKLRNRRRGQVARAGRRALLVECAVGLACAALWRSRVLRRALLALETRLFATDLHAAAFARHRPDLVVCASPGWFAADAIVLREAQRRGIRTAALVLGWDNPTSKGYRGADPDLVVAWSERMAGQLASLHDLPRERIAVGGVPTWDAYAHPGSLPDRAALCAEMGLDPGRRILVFATSTPSGYDGNEAVVRRLAAAIDGGELGAACQLVVRLHPINFRPDVRPDLGEMAELAARHEHVHLDVPEIVSERLRCDMPASDARRLGALLRHCDVLLNVFSTTTLEAFLLDRPVVFVGASDGPGRPGDPDPRTYTSYTHLRELVEAGAARIAGSGEEMVEHVRTYLAHPELEREQRLAFARRECGPTDGNAGRRVAGLLIAAAPGERSSAQRLPPVGGTKRRL